MNERRLATYLNDRHAILTAGTQLADRARTSNADTVYGPLLERIAQDLESDHALLRTLMDANDVSPDRVKSSLAWVGEKLGRLKPNDQLVGYSPLSRVIEFDGLTAIIATLDGTWVALKPLLTAQQDELEAAHARAQRNLDELGSLRPQAVHEAVVD